MSILPPPSSDPSRDDAGKPSSTSPPIKMKVRPDLAFDQMTYQGVEYWVVKEPLAQKYFQFPPHVFYLLTQLDGTRSIEELQDGYHAEFAPKRITRQDLQQLLTRFHQDGLVTSDLPGQGAELLKRGQKNSRMELVSQMANILAIRYKGFDPERILNFLLPYTWWIFTKAAAIVVMLLASIALVSVLANWAQFQAKLPGFEAFFDPRQWYMFALVLCVTKVFHEFGHGLSCKRLGGECHEIGFMLLVLTPCLYCNVSDSWRLPNKWHRAAIGAAGMYVEVILATIATFIWWFVQPGFIQDICLKVMLVSSISTILFNGNPLLRFDGYYILSDILEIPNLNQKSTKALTTLLGRHWLGLEIPDDQLMPTNRPIAFAMFTVAAFCYRWFIMFSIIFFLMTMLEPYNLESVGVGIALFSMVGMLLMPAYKLYKYMSVPGRMHQVKKVRFGVVLAVAVLLIAMVLLIPFPFYLKCNLVLVPQKIDTVWVNESGRLEECLVKEGDVVAEGQTIATLVNAELDLELESLEAKIFEKQEELLLEQRKLSVGQVEDRTQAIVKGLVKLQVDRQQALRKREMLKINSPMAGTILATPYEHQGNATDEVEEANLQPLIEGNHTGITAVRGQRFCEVADLDRWFAIVILTEHQIKFAATEQDVRLKLYSDPGRIYEGKIEHVGETEYSISRQDYEPDQQKMMQQGGGQPRDRISEMVAVYQHRDLQYYARVPLEDTQGTLRIGTGGQARIYVDNRSLGYRLWWWFNQNFRS